MKKITTILSLALCLLTLSCVKEEGVNEKSSFEATLVADTGSTKTSLDGKNVLWLKDDAISVFPDGGENACFVTSEGGATAKFKGELPWGTATVYAVYPYDKTAKFEKGKFDASIPSSQLAVKGGFDSGLVVMTATGIVDSNNSATLHFKQTNGLVKFTVASADVQSVSLIAPAGTPLVGKATVPFDQSEVKVSKGESSITIAPASGNFTPGDYCITAWPAAASGCKLVYQIGEKTKTRKLDDAFAVTRAHITVIEGSENDLPWDGFIPKVTASLVSVSSSTAVIGWETNAQEPPSSSYVAAIYKDQACSQLEVSWTVSSFATGYYRFVFAGLEPATKYWAKVTDCETAAVSDPVEITTAAKGWKAMPEKAAKGDVILQEDFSELIYGGDELAFAPGYAQADMANFVIKEFKKAQGADPAGFALVAYNKSFTLGKGLANAVKASRLKDWGAVIASGVENRAYGEAGYVKVGSGANLPTMLCTPELKCLTDEAKLKVTFRACGYPGDALQNIDVALVAPGAPIRYDESTTSQFTLTAKADLKKSFTLGSSWAEYSVEVDGVAPGSRIGVGTLDGTGFRAFIDDVKVELVSYASGSVKIGDAKLSEVESGVFEGTFDVPASTSFCVNVAGTDYGFVTYSGAGGLGTCKDENSALPYFKVKTTSSKQTYTVAKTTGMMAPGANPFWVNLTAPSKVFARINTNTSVYYFKVVKDADPSVVFEENFDLLVWGGDWMAPVQGVTRPADGLAAGKTGQAFTKGDPVSVIKEVVELDGWEFDQDQIHPLCVQLGAGGAAGSITTPKFSSLTGPADLTITADIARLAAGSKQDVWFDVVGGGKITEASIKVDYFTFGGEPQTKKMTEFTEGNTRLALVCDDYFSYAKDWSGAGSANNSVDKPYSHLTVKISGATADTRICMHGSTNDSRFLLFNIKATK